MVMVIVMDEATAMAQHEPLSRVVSVVMDMDEATGESRL